MLTKLFYPVSSRFWTPRSSAGPSRLLYTESTIGGAARFFWLRFVEQLSGSTSFSCAIDIGFEPKMLLQEQYATLLLVFLRSVFKEVQGGRLLVSPENPPKECHRFVEQLSGSTSFSCAIDIGFEPKMLLQEQYATLLLVSRANPRIVQCFFVQVLDPTLFGWAVAAALHGIDHWRRSEVFFGLVFKEVQGGRLLVSPENPPKECHRFVEMYNLWVLGPGRGCSRSVHASLEKAVKNRAPTAQCMSLGHHRLLKKSERQNAKRSWDKPRTKKAVEVESEDEEVDDEMERMSSPATGNPRERTPTLQEIDVEQDSPRAPLGWEGEIEEDEELASQVLTTMLLYDESAPTWLSIVQNSDATTRGNDDGGGGDEGLPPAWDATASMEPPPSLQPTAAIVAGRDGAPWPGPAQATRLGLTGRMG
ncbi:hypothetical protein B0H15DRAFT_806841 [Mycena belliarum]|uniref:Uncharacterized protein n=1 Tax=Mycena belliarum TaxID=1033014 RepID=A0AAD6TMN1_9AGAR|nr:hypothetical protein B0H15DRAFT_806841 [Mycena belliae]